jgi:hypothetical protein
VAEVAPVGRPFVTQVPGRSCVPLAG